MSNKALLVGVNKYQLAGSDLSGCVNDATNMRDILLKYFGFTTKEITILVDERATKKNILDRLKWLVNKAKSNDRLLFHFSGHGSQIVDIRIPAQRRQSRCLSRFLPFRYGNKGDGGHPRPSLCAFFQAEVPASPGGHSRQGPNPQTSADAQIGGSYNGAFTYYTCKHLRDTKGSISRTELIKRVRASLKFNGFSQIPQLEAPAVEKKKKLLE